MFILEGRQTVEELHFLTLSALDDFKTRIFTLHSVEYLWKGDCKSTLILFAAYVGKDILAHLCVNIYTGRGLGPKNKNEIATLFRSISIASSIFHLFLSFFI